MADRENQRSDSVRTPWPFRPRWRIEGCLFTLSPLHIGSGETTTHPDLVNRDEPVQISACAKDGQRNPIIPGSSLKGALRGWLRRRGLPDERVAEVFGRDAPETPARQSDGTERSDAEAADRAEREDDKARDGIGGKAEFHDACLGITRTGETPLPHWRPDRHTYVEVSTCIDRPTRTVADDKLFHLEAVPAGTGFRVEIEGCFGPRDADGKEHGNEPAEVEVAWLLAGLEGFNDTSDPVTLGADTASGKGRLRWELAAVRCMDGPAVADWVRSPNRRMGRDALPVIGNEQLGGLLEKARRVVGRRRSELTFAVTLRFDAAFLVNDPPTEREKKVAREAKPPDARPRLDAMGEPVLPAKSFRGALRSQAERIIRTLGGYACNPAGKSACRPVETLDEIRQVRTGIGKEGLCLACRLFGAPGWKTPLAISDFTLKPEPGTGTPLTQEFVAIDRFTGGGKEGAKFNARSLYHPVFRGRLALDRSRLSLARSPTEGLGCWELGLLALVLRDLMEGDITFGYGASKGYGACTAEIEGWDDAAFRTSATEGLRVLRDAITGQWRRTDTDLSKGDEA